MSNCLASCKSCFPFRLGCTSWVIPDNIIPNVRKMAEIVDDIELVIFESPDFGNIPDKDAVNELTDIAKQSSLTYSVHLPTNYKACSFDKNERNLFVSQALRVIELFDPSVVSGYIMHLESVKPFAKKSCSRDWLKRAYDTCNQLSAAVKENSGRMLIENLADEISVNLDISKKCNFGLCLDIGHMLISDINWNSTFSNHISNSSVIHLHGVNADKDHLSLAKGSRDDILEIIRIIKESEFRGVVTLEVFGLSDTFESLEVFKQLWQM